MASLCGVLAYQQAQFKYCIKSTSGQWTIYVEERKKERKKGKKNGRKEGRKAETGGREKLGDRERKRERPERTKTTLRNRKQRQEGEQGRKIKKRNKDEQRIRKGRLNSPELVFSDGIRLHAFVFFFRKTVPLTT